MIALDDAAWAAPWRTVSVGAKLALSGALLATAILTPPWPGAVLVAIAAVALTLGPAKIPPRMLAIAMAAPLVFVLIGVITIAITVGPTPADAWWSLGPLSMNAASAASAGGVLARSLAGTLAVMLLATTTPISDLLAWTRRRGMPAVLVDVASLTYRLIFVFAESLLVIRAAQTARLGNDPVGSGARKRRFNTVASAAGTVAVRAWHQSVRLNEGLEARGLDDDLILSAQPTATSRRFALGAAAAVALVWVAIGASQVLA